MEKTTIRTYPAGIPVTMERKLPNVAKIVINPDEFWIFHGRGRDEFKRGDWRLYIEDVEQAQEEVHDGLRTLFLMKGFADPEQFEPECSCRVIEEKKIVFCGEHPEKMRYL